MATETATLQKISEDLEYLKQKVDLIEEEITIIKDIEPKVREEYLEKLRAIEREKGRKFTSKKDFLNYLENEL